MSDENAAGKLNFALPSQTIEKENFLPKLMIVLLVLILFAVAANMLIAIIRPLPSTSFQNNSLPDSASRKQLALKLEKQGLHNVASTAWKEYLLTANLDASETAMIWYRIGKLYQDNHEFENALDSYYRSESVATLDSISSEIAIRIQECLESMGKFSAMRHELADRVGFSTAADVSATSDTIVAEIGSLKISTSELDRHMEKSIERQMRLMAPFLPDDERNKQKENLLRQFSTPANRQMYLNQLIVEEVLYRNARENHLADTPDVRDMIKDQERSLLARLVLENAYSDKINITLSDLENYFEANKDTFVKEGNTPAFEDIKSDVYQKLRAEKEQEVQQQLLNHLKEKYDMVIHKSALASETPVQNDGSRVK